MGRSPGRRRVRTERGLIGGRDPRDLGGIDGDLAGTGGALESAAVATSVDGFARTIAAPPSATSTSMLAVTNVMGTLEIRIYGYGATGASGTMRVQNAVQVTGALQ